MGLSVNGLTKYREAFGFADLENAVSATIQTHYRQASISKTFTSAILAEIVDKKLANFDDALNKHLNFSIFPQKTWKSQPVKITLRQLLSHTAGLYSTKDNEEFAIVKEYHNLTEYIAKHKNKPLLFEPGHGYSYSNYGFQVVGAVIEAITGQSFLKVMTDFLKRHHLDKTSLETRQSLIRNAAQYYYFKKDHFYENIPAPLYDDLVIAESNWASGGLVSTVDDLLKWGNLFIDSFKGKNNSFLKPETLKQLWTPQTVNLSSVDHHNDYCLGWHKVSLNRKKYPTNRYRHYFNHNGGLYGVFTSLMVFPEEEIVAVTFINKGEMPIDPQVIMHQMIERLVPLV